jgi:hypothetical protein
MSASESMPYSKYMDLLINICIILLLYKDVDEPPFFLGIEPSSNAYSYNI